MVIHTYGVREMGTGVWFGYMKGADCCENLGIDGKVINMEHAWWAWTGDEPAVFHNINFLIS